MGSRDKEEKERLLKKKEKEISDAKKKLAAENIKGIAKADLEEGGAYYFKPNGYEDSYAREENFFSSICELCCPAIRWSQFITIISLVEFAIFIISCCIYGINNEEFLSPDPHALRLLGWQDSKKIKNNWEIYRWVTPILLHGNFEHLAGNVVG